MILSEEAVSARAHKKKKLHEYGTKTGRSQRKDDQEIMTRQKRTRDENEKGNIVGWGGLNSSPICGMPRCRRGGG